MASLLSRWAESIRSLVISPINAKDPAVARLFDGGPVASGVPVNEWNALTFSAVWAAVGQISSTVASLPLKFYKRLPDGGKEPFTGHKLYELLHDNPNSEMTSFIFREILQAHLLTWGNAFAEIERDGAGRPAAIWPIPPDRVDPIRDSRDRLVYRVRGDRLGDIIIPAADMLHVPGLGFDGMKGYGVVQMARESLGLGLAAERFGGTFFGNGSTFGGFLSHPAKLSPEARQNLQESLAKHSGPTKAHRILLLQENMTFIERKGIPPNDAQFLETRLFQVQEVARWLRISPYKLGDLSRATFSNIEHQAIEYYTDTIRPWLVRWEQEINRKLVSPLERRQQFAEFVIEGALRGDVQSRYSAYAVGRQWGWLSANDVRGLENMNPLPNDQGDIYLVPMNMTPASRIDEIIDKQVAPDPKPVAPPPAGEPSEEQTNSLKRAIELLEARREADGKAIEEARAAAVAASEALALATGEATELRASKAAADARVAELERGQTQTLIELSLALEKREEHQAIAEAARAEAEAKAAEARQAAEMLAVEKGATSELRLRMVEREERITEATTALGAVNEQRDRLEAQAAEAQRVAEALTLERDGLKVALDAAISDRETASEACAVAEGMRVAAEAGMEAARTAAAAALVDRDAALAASEANQAEAAELAGRVEVLSRDIVARSAVIDAQVAERGVREAASAAELAQKQDELAARVAEADALTVERDLLQAGVATSEAALAEAEEALASARAAEAEQAQNAAALAIQYRDAAASVDALTARLAAAAAAVAERDRLAAQQAAELAAARAREAEQAEASAEAIRVASQERERAQGQVSGLAEERDAALAAVREAEAARSAGRGAMVSAHRSLYQDAMTRLIEREIDKMLGARSSANKLRTAMGPFYDRHQEIVTRDLVPLVRVHLSFIRGDQDPDAMAADLAEQHISQSRAELAEVCEADADEFPTQLSQLIQRWRSRRTSDLAELLMRREIEHG